MSPKWVTWQRGTPSTCWRHGILWILHLQMTRNLQVRSKRWTKSVSFAQKKTQMITWDLPPLTILLTRMSLKRTTTFVGSTTGWYPSTVSPTHTNSTQWASVSWWNSSTTTDTTRPYLGTSRPINSSRTMMLTSVRSSERSHTLRPWGRRSGDLNRRRRRASNERRPKGSRY